MWNGPAGKCFPKKGVIREDVPKRTLSEFGRQLSGLRNRPEIARFVDGRRYGAKSYEFPSRNTVQKLPSVPKSAAQFMDDP